MAGSMAVVPGDVTHDTGHSQAMPRQQSPSQQFSAQGGFTSTGAAVAGGRIPTALKSSAANNNLMRAKSSLRRALSNLPDRLSVPAGTAGP